MTQIMRRWSAAAMLYLTASAPTRGEGVSAAEMQAVGDEGRAIAVATSTDMRPK